MKNPQISWKLLLIAIVVIVLGFAGVLYWESQTPLGCGGSCPPTYTPEKIAFNSVRVNSPTNLTLTLSNPGTIIWGLVAYYVKDSYGNQYSNTTWVGPTVSPGASAPVNILVAGKLTGQPFQIQSGQTYEITVLTARNNAFPYTFTA